MHGKECQNQVKLKAKEAQKSGVSCLWTCRHIMLLIFAKIQQYLVNTLTL